jgi:hypothetical protein
LASQAFHIFWTELSPCVSFIGEAQKKYNANSAFWPSTRLRCRGF